MVDPGSVEGTPPAWAASGRPGFWLIAAAIILVLFAGWWFVLRSPYLPVLVNLETQDAADIAKVLDAKKIPYRFEDSGHTIAVPSDQADKARVELAGSELPMKGQIGFELFNQSDMGLTEFAQKINFQRALQGELARTILLLDGIQTVRVHLALPERSLFRGEQEQAKASVTLILKPGKALSSVNVVGIQRLVAGAVPDLAADAVTVLDGTGRMISPETPTSTPAEVSSDAVLGSVRQRIVSVVARAHPELRFSAIVSLHYVQDGPTRDDPKPEAAPAEPTPATNGSRGVPDYVYSVRLITEQPIDDGLRADLQRIISQELGLDPARGDSLVFVVGPLVADQAPVSPAIPDQIVARAESPPSAPSSFNWQDWWLALPAAAVLIIAAAVWRDRRRRSARREADLASFAETLRRRLEAEA